MSVNIFYSVASLDGYVRETDDDCSGGSGTVIWDDWYSGPHIRCYSDFGFATPYHIRRGYFYPDLSGFSIPVGQYVSKVQLFLYATYSNISAPVKIYSLAFAKSHWATVQDHFNALGAGSFLANGFYDTDEGHVTDLGAAACAYITAHPTFAGFAILVDESSVPTDDKYFHDSQAVDDLGAPFGVPYLEVTLSPLASNKFFFAARNYPANGLR